MSNQSVPYDDAARFYDEVPNPKRKRSLILRVLLFLLVSFIAVLVYVQVPWFHQRRLPEIVGELLKTEALSDELGQYCFRASVQDSEIPEIGKNWARELMVESGISLATADNRRYSHFLGIERLTVHHAFAGFPIPLKTNWKNPVSEKVKKRLDACAERLDRILAVVDKKTDFYLPIDVGPDESIYFFKIRNMSYRFALRQLEGALFSRIQLKMHQGEWEQAIREIVKLRKLSNSLQKNSAIGTCVAGAEFARSAFECEKNWFLGDRELEPKQLVRMAKEIYATLPRQHLFKSCQRLAYVELLDRVQMYLTFDVDDPRHGRVEDPSPVDFRWVNREVVFRIADQWYQKFWDAWKIEQPADRILAMKAVVKQLQEKEKTVREWQSSYAWLSVGSRSELFVYHTMCRSDQLGSDSMGVGAFEQIISEEEWCIDTHSRSKLSALACLFSAYLLENSKVPESWAAIKSEFIEQIGSEAEFEALITDPMTGSEYMFRSTDKGVELSGESAVSLQSEKISLWLPWTS